jgi:plastocyanin
MFARKELLLMVFGYPLLYTNIAYAVTHEVSMIENVFVPETLSIETGDTVMWINNGSISHTATSGTGCSSDGLWDSGLISPGNSFSFAFDSAADYPYFCIPHCNLGMIGLIRVLQTGIEIEETDSFSVFEFMNTPPNLFAGEIEIFYEMKVREYINITVYSVDGQSVINLFNGIQEKGIHSVSWNGKNRNGVVTSDGIYFCLGKIKKKGYLYKFIKIR